MWVTIRQVNVRIICAPELLEYQLAAYFIQSAKSMVFLLLSLKANIKCALFFFQWIHAVLLPDITQCQSQTHIQRRMRCWATKPATLTHVAHFLCKHADFIFKFFIFMKRKWKYFWRYGVAVRVPLVSHFLASMIYWKYMQGFGMYILLKIFERFTRRLKVNALWVSQLTCKQNPTICLTYKFIDGHVYSSHLIEIAGRLFRNLNNIGVTEYESIIV